jgi:hypothetical protein
MPDPMMPPMTRRVAAPGPMARSSVGADIEMADYRREGARCEGVEGLARRSVKAAALEYVGA